MAMSRMPREARLRRLCSRIGLPLSARSTLGIWLVRGPNLEPRPAARTTSRITCHRIRASSNLPTSSVPFGTRNYRPHAAGFTDQWLRTVAGCGKNRYISIGPAKLRPGAIEFLDRLVSLCVMDHLIENLGRDGHDVSAGIICVNHILGASDTACNNFR